MATATGIRAQIFQREAMSLLENSDDYKSIVRCTAGRDPDDWDVFRELVYGALDRVIAICGRSVTGWFGRPRPKRLVISSRLPFRTPHVNLRSVLVDFERKYQAIRDRREPIVHGLGAWCRSSVGMLMVEMLAGLNANWAAAITSASMSKIR
jgi:hypothetical protein